MAGSGPSVLLPILFVLFSMMISVLVITSLSLDDIKTGLNKCNNSTCYSTGCTKAYCEGDQCIRSPLSSCCDGGNCANVDAADFNFGILHVDNMSATANSTIGMAFSDILFKDGSVASVCLISDGTCSGKLGPTGVEQIITDKIITIGGESCLDINGGALVVCSNGSTTIGSGQLIVNYVNVSNIACVRQALPLSGGVININGALLQNGSISIPNLIVQETAYVNQILTDLNATQVIISGVYVNNNSISGLVGGVPSNLLLNPFGGNVGFAVQGYQLSNVIYTAQSGGVIYATGGYYFDKSKELNGGVQSEALNAYFESKFNIDWFGPWPSSVQNKPAYMVVLQNTTATLTIATDLIYNCTGIPVTAFSANGFNAGGYLPSSNFTEPTRIIMDSVIVEGYIKIATDGSLEIGSYLPGGIINGSRPNMCGFYQTSISWFLG